MSTRRSLLTSTLAAFAMAGLPAFASAQDFPKPKQPLVISVIDVAGDLQLSQQALEAYRKAHPDLVAKFVYTQATAPEPNLRRIVGLASTNQWLSEKVATTFPTSRVQALAVSEVRDGAD